jgi:hypothetical protein
MEGKESVQIHRPALLPDDRRLVWYPLGVCGVAAVVGYCVGNVPLAVIPLLVLAVFPGIPVAIHGVFFLSVRIMLDGDTLVVIDWAGDPFVAYPRRQEIALSSVAYAYHLKKEADAHKSEAEPAVPFSNTRIRMKKYRAADADPRRVGAVARCNNGLILSDAEGPDKIYIMHFHDLSKGNWQRLARQIRQRNPRISFLMTDHERDGLLGPNT